MILGIKGKLPGTAGTVNPSTSPQTWCREGRRRSFRALLLAGGVARERAPERYLSCRSAHAGRVVNRRAVVVNNRFCLWTGVAEADRKWNWRGMMKRAVVVLGGGGVKGMAHVGAWKAVEEAGLAVVGIVGTSIGALVGACIAGGRGWNELVPQALSLVKADIVSLNRWALLLNGIRQPSIFNREPFFSYIERVLPVSGFDELNIPLAINAVDLEDGSEVWFGAGGRTDAPLAEVVYASCALPMFYPPAEIDGRFLVDGGVRDTVALERALAWQDADVVVAVDASAGGARDALDTVAKGMLAVHNRVFDIMAHARRQAVRAAWAGPPLVYVRPRLDGFSTFDFTRTQYFLEEGYRATRQALQQEAGVSA
jgi:NTE family protein